MEKIKINGNEMLYEIESIKPHLPNVLQIVFSGTVLAGCGIITIYADGGIMGGTLAGDDTIYRDDGQTVYLSNDDSVYSDLEDTEALPEESYIYTMEELQPSEVNTACNAAITAGCDVTLTDGSVEHYQRRIRSI